MGHFGTEMGHWITLFLDPESIEGYIYKSNGIITGSISVKSEFDHIV
jgi:hypothetical protein